MFPQPPNLSSSMSHKVLHSWKYIRLIERSCYHVLEVQIIQHGSYKLLDQQRLPWLSNFQVGNFSLFRRGLLCSWGRLLPPEEQGALLAGAGLVVKEVLDSHAIIVPSWV